MINVEIKSAAKVATIIRVSYNKKMNFLQSKQIKVNPIIIINKLSVFNKGILRSDTNVWLIDKIAAITQRIANKFCFRSMQCDKTQIPVKVQVKFTITFKR